MDHSELEQLTKRFSGKIHDLTEHYEQELDNLEQAFIACENYFNGRSEEYPAELLASVGLA